MVKAYVKTERYTKLSNLTVEERHERKKKQAREWSQRNHVFKIGPHSESAERSSKKKEEKELAKQERKRIVDERRQLILNGDDKTAASKLRHHLNRLSNPESKLAHVYRKRIASAFKAAKVPKKSKFTSLLGCSFEQAKMHIENQFQEWMSWDNHGEWHIDHIRPCASFDLTDPKQLKECFHYTNLQPLSARDNLSKNSLGFRFKKVA